MYSVSESKSEFAEINLLHLCSPLSLLRLHLFQSLLKHAYSLEQDAQGAEGLAGTTPEFFARFLLIAR